MLPTTVAFVASTFHMERPFPKFVGEKGVTMLATQSNGLVVQDFSNFVAQPDLARLPSDFLRWPSLCLDTFPEPSGTLSGALSPSTSPRGEAQVLRN